MRLMYDENITNGNIPEEVMDKIIRDLDLKRLAVLLSPPGRVKYSAKDILCYMTDNPELIRYRQDLTMVLFESDDVFNELNILYSKLEGLGEIADDMTHSSKKEIANFVIIIKWMDLFTGIIEDFHTFFNNNESLMKVRSLAKLKKLIFEIRNSESFQILKSNTAELKIENHKLNSIKIGINLNDYLEPVSACCLEVNDFYYHPRKIADLSKSSDKIRGIGRFKYVPAGRRREGVVRYDEINARAVLVNTNKIQRMVSCDIDVEFMKSIDLFFKTLNFNSRNTVKKFIMEKTAELVEITSDLGFVLGGTAFAKKLKEKGMPLCMPEINTEECRYDMKNLYNCYLPFILPNAAENIVCNDVNLSDLEKFAILNGPNKGGKTTIIQAICISIILAQLGFLCPSEKAEMYPVDLILTHYQQEDNKDLKGRLAKDAESIRLIFTHATQRSLVILNEPYVATSPGEGMFLILSTLKGIRKLGCRGILVTHYHKLNDRVEDENKESRQKIKFLNMGIDLTDGNSERTYRLNHGRGELKSFAKDILMEYAPDLLY